MSIELTPWRDLVVTDQDGDQDLLESIMETDVRHFDAVQIGHDGGIVRWPGYYLSESFEAVDWRGFVDALESERTLQAKEAGGVAVAAQIAERPGAG